MLVARRQNLLAFGRQEPIARVSIGARSFLMKKIELGTRLFVLISLASWTILDVAIPALGVPENLQ